MLDYNLIIGLGNPGIEYSGTRHNVGYIVLDKIIDKFQLNIYKKKNI